MTGGSPSRAVRFSQPGEVAYGVTRTRRTPRDWLVDVAAFCGAVLLGLAVLGLAQKYEHPPSWVSAADLPLGALACASLWWRRHFPLAVSTATVPALAMANSAFGAGLMIVLNLALRVPLRRSLPLLGLYVASSALYVLLVPSREGDSWEGMAFVLAYYLIAFAWGSALRSRRLLVHNLREETERERAEQVRRLAEARHAERRAIAREMHDVLAHRISMLSVHAGALAYRTERSAADAGPRLSSTEIAEASRIIRKNAHQALEELHNALTVLHAADGDDATAPPQTRMSDIETLVDEARAVQQRVDLDDRLEGGLRGREAGILRPQLQRTAYRVVQEGLTNARKHAPDAPVTVLLAGGPGRGLIVEVANATTGAVSMGIPGAGAGLTGLGERVRLESGTLEHGSDGGGFTLRARLPWHSEADR